MFNSNLLEITSLAPNLIDVCLETQSYPAFYSHVDSVAVINNNKLALNGINNWNH